MAHILCRVAINEVGTVQWIPEKSTDNVVVFNVFPRDGSRIDMRGKAPFLSLIPCPYCATEDDRKHDALMHVDRRFGTPIFSK